MHVQVLMVCIPSTTQAAKFSWAKNISSDLHCNDSTNLLSLASSANAYLISILSIVNTVGTLQLFFDITVTLNQIEVTSETWTSIVSRQFSVFRCNVRFSLRCPCTIDWQFSRPARLIFPSGASRPIGNIRTHRVRVETIFGGLPCRRSITPCVSLSRAYVLSFAHYFQAPATQATQHCTL